MPDLYFHSNHMYAAARSMEFTGELLTQLTQPACAPKATGLIFGPRTPGLQAAQMLSERVADSANFAALMVQYASDLVSRFETTANVFQSIEAGS